MADEELTRAESVAKRAMELAARAEELARQAHEVSGVDEQLAALEAELEELAAEEAAIDAGPDGDGPPDGAPDPWADLTETLSARMEALGYRLGDLLSGGLEATMPAGPSESSKVIPVAGPVPLRVSLAGGSVDVRAGSSDRVVVTWRGRGVVTAEERDGTVYVETSARLVLRSKVSHVRVEVPRGSPVDVTTGGGSLRVEGSDGPVRARTGGGSIRIDGMDGELSATTGGGSIRVRGRLRGESTIRTGGGAIGVSLAPGSRIDVDAHGTMASIDVAGLRVKGLHVTGAVGGGGEGRLSASSGGGAVRIRED